MKRHLAAAAIAVVLAATVAACAAPIQRVSTAPAAKPRTDTAAPSRGLDRQSVGVAFGGGSARGIAHAGVIRWMEEHRIPIDVAAGTSMGGLIGGAFATGMDATELSAFIREIDWDRLFGASSFAYKNVRRKADARAYPSRLEFGLKRGIVPPSALNSGEQVELLLGRLAAPYFAIDDFDGLPTPFRTVAVDLLSAQIVVMRSGSLADAMRATMSLPLVFPPVEIDGQVLIDGGTMDNVPADVVKGMGADVVVAINVGNLSARDGVSRTMFSVGDETIGAMMRASTKRALASADVVIDVPLAGYGSLDWRRAGDLIDEGYRAAEAMRDQLLPLALSEADFQSWRSERQRRRRTDLPVPVFVQLNGFGANDEKRLSPVLATHIGVPLNVDALDQDVVKMAAIDRYETVTWRLVSDAARGVGLQVNARVKPYAPPFMMLSLDLANTTSNDFRITSSARYLRFDVAGSGSELRVDGTVGSDRSLAIELFRPIGTTPLFIAPYAGLNRVTSNFVEADVVRARYRQMTTRVGVSAGVQLGDRSDLRTGVYMGRRSASVSVGDPGFPELRGKETGAEILWRLDTQDSPVVPAGGTLSEVRLWHTFTAPDVVNNDQVIATVDPTTQLAAAAGQFWSVGRSNRVFVFGAIGTSFDSTPLPSDEFALGTPFRLSASKAGELRGRHSLVATVGYLRRVGRLPDFLGGSIFAGGWIENGDAVNEWRDASWRTNSGAGVVMDTIVGPVLVAGTWSYDGNWKTYIGIGRLFR